MSVRLAALDVRQEEILLSFVETMDLIQEEDLWPLIRERIRIFDDLSDVVSFPAETADSS